MAVFKEGKIGTSTICLAEVWEGVFGSPHKERDEKTLKSFFKELDIIWFPNEKVAKIFGKLRNDLRKKGKLIADLDLLIASICLNYDLILVTSDIDHFKRIKGLKIYK